MIKGQLVDIQIGRAHIYDTNNSPEHLKMITAPLIVAKGLGVNWIVTTNAAGVLENGMIEKGDVVVDADYVNQ
ncbi:MAG: purine-nucleoside phosphorylase, partial [Patescibacteria group bacterium]